MGEPCQDCNRNDGGRCLTCGLVSVCWYINLKPADSVEDYLDRYYKPTRRTETLAGTYHEQLDQYGYVSTSSHDNITGTFIGWTPGNCHIIPNPNAARRLAEIKAGMAGKSFRELARMEREK